VQSFDTASRAVGKRFSNMACIIVVFCSVKTSDSEAEIIVSCLLINEDGMKQKKKR
jgi:hypothetical protein